MPPWEIGPFWQKQQRRLQPEKNTAPAPCIPTRHGSSHRWSMALAATGRLGWPQMPPARPSVRSAPHSRGQRRQIMARPPLEGTECPMTDAGPPPETPAPSAGSSGREKRPYTGAAASPHGPPGSASHRPKSAAANRTTLNAVPTAGDPARLHILSAPGTGCGGWWCFSLGLSLPSSFVPIPQLLKKRGRVLRGGHPRLCACFRLKVPGVFAFFPKWHGKPPYGWQSDGGS